MYLCIFLNIYVFNEFILFKLISFLTYLFEKKIKKLFFILISTLTVNIFFYSKVIG